MSIDLKTTVFDARDANLISAGKSERVTFLKPPLPFAKGRWKIWGTYWPRWFIAFGRLKNPGPETQPAGFIPPTGMGI
jgi:hypothetical protein